MATSSILGGSKLPEEISGKDLQTLGPSDNSDSGSDAVGAYGDEALASDSDAAGTGERASAAPGGEALDVDSLPRHVEKIPDPQADPDLDEQAGDDFDDLSDIEDLSDDIGDLDTERDDDA